MELCSPRRNKWKLRYVQVTSCHLLFFFSWLGLWPSIVQVIAPLITTIVFFFALFHIYSRVHLSESDSFRFVAKELGFLLFIELSLVSLEGHRQSSW